MKTLTTDGGKRFVYMLRVLTVFSCACCILSPLPMIMKFCCCQFSPFVYTKISNLRFLSQAKGPGYPAGPAGPGMVQSPGNNPYSRGGYGGGYPRPTAGYPQ